MNRPTDCQLHLYQHDGVTNARLERAPYVRGSETSEAAAESTLDTLGRLEAKVWAAIAGAGAYGLTDQEQQQVTGLDPSTQRPRRVRLVELGLVKDSGQKRPTHAGRNAVVWVTAAAATGPANEGAPADPPGCRQESGRKP